jgi:hypothetical protein
MEIEENHETFDEAVSLLAKISIHNLQITKKLYLLDRNVQ